MAVPAFGSGEAYNLGTGSRPEALTVKRYRAKFSGTHLFPEKISTERHSRSHTAALPAAKILLRLDRSRHSMISTKIPKLPPSRSVPPTVKLLIRLAQLVSTLLFRRVYVSSREDRRRRQIGEVDDCF